MSTLENAGIPILEALPLARSHVRSWGFSRTLSDIEQSIRDSESLYTALCSHRRYFSPMERALIRAGEQAGSLDEIFKNLSGWFEFLYRLKNDFVKRILYPLFIYHFAAFVIPFPSFFLEETSSLYLTKVILILLPLYAVFLFAGVIAPFLRKNLPPLRAAIDTVIVYIPFVRGVIIKLDMLRFCTAFRVATEAGIPLKQILVLASDTCTNMYTRRLTGKLQAAADNGEPIHTVMKQIRIFPDIMVRMFETGEKGGKLEQAAEKVEEYFHDEVRSALSMLTRGLSVLIYLGVVVFVAYNIISMAGKVFDTIREAGNGM